MKGSRPRKRTWRGVCCGLAGPTGLGLVLTPWPPAGQGAQRGAAELTPASQLRCFIHSRLSRGAPHPDPFRGSAQGLREKLDPRPQSPKKGNTSCVKEAVKVWMGSRVAAFAKVTQPTS